MLLYTFAVRNLGAQTVVLLMAFVPGLAALSAVPVLGDPLSLLTIAGLGAVTIGAVFASRQPSARPAGFGDKITNPPVLENWKPWSGGSP